MADWYQADEWKLEGLCVTNDEWDTTWIEKSDPEHTEGFLAARCAGCAVFDECFQDAVDFEVVDVFQAGQWWPAPDLGDGFESDDVFIPLEVV